MEFDNRKRLELESLVHARNFTITGDRCFFSDVTDLHIGHIGFDEQAFTNFSKDVLRVPNFFIHIGGDSTNHANKGSKSSQYEEYMNPNEQLWGKYENGKLVRKGMLQLFTPLILEGRVLGISDGNHNTTRLREYNGMSVPEYFCTIVKAELGIVLPYLGEMAYYEFVVGLDPKNRNSYTHYITHHSGSTGKKKSMGALQDRAVNFEADVLWGEHTHRDPYARDLVAYFDRHNKKIRYRDRLYINGNSYLSWSGYAKEKGMTPNLTGSKIVEMSGKRGDWDMRVYERVKDFHEFVIEREGW